MNAVEKQKGIFIEGNGIAETIASELLSSGLSVITNAHPEWAIMDWDKGISSELKPLWAHNETPKGFRQKKGDKPIQHGPAKRSKW